MNELHTTFHSPRTALRLRLALSGATLALICAPSVAYAQETPAPAGTNGQPAAPANPNQVDAQTQKVDEQAPGGQANVSSQPPAEGDIVVTGTLLRGTAPVGSNLIAIGQAKIASTGATTANELLASVPQVSNLFNNVPTSRLGVATNQIQVVRPNLRNLAGETSSSSSTLVLFDGHRIAPVGVTQNAIDPDIIPPIAIERVEVVTDGGSATYGSDAVGGVINFITRKRFDGVKVEASYGVADHYNQYEAGAIIGKDWGTGSLFLAYNYQHNDPLFAHDRAFIRDVDWLSPSLTPRGRSCIPGNVQVGNNLFALRGLTSATPNACDYGDSSVVPRSTRHGALAGLHQELASWLTVDLRAFYGQRETTGFADFTGSVNINGASSPGFTIPGVITIPPSFRNFYYMAVPGQSPTANQTVFFDLSPLLGRNTLLSGTRFQEWGTNAEFQANLTSNWELRTLFNYSESKSEFHIQQLNPGLLSAFASGPNSVTAAGAIDFYNPGTGSSDVANIQQLINSELAGEGKEQLFDARAILDGSLFTLPGGPVKLAAGVEHMNDGFQQRTSPANGVIGAIATQPYASYSRHIDSAFGEVQVPIVGEGNRTGFIYSLTLAGSVRYDRFSDFGHTTNPKIGIDFKPVRWLGLRGNYNTSFNAPSPNDQLGALRNTASYFPFNAFVRPGDTPTANGAVALQGSNPGLLPQTAKSWSAGIDLDAPFLQGLHASANYYNVRFKNVISIPTPSAGIFATFPNNISANPGGLSLAQITQFLNASGATGAATTLATVAAGCSTPAACRNVYELVDFRQGNYGSLNVQGLDFSLNYRASTSFGGVDAGVAGNYQLSRKSQTGAGSPVVDQLRLTNLLLPGGLTIQNDASPRLQASATLGADIGNFRAQATLNHSSGFAVVRCDPTTIPACLPSATGIPTANGTPQDRVSAFNTVNLFFKYDVRGSGVLSGLEFTLNVNNVFDTDPPVFRRIANATPGYTNGFTLGRLFQFGISKKF